MIRFFSVLFPIFALINVSSAAEFDIDTGHSSVNFKVRHLVAKTTGRFEHFKGTVNYTEGKPADWKVSAEIEMASINTDNAKRDEHLKSPDFFNVQKNPKMTFVSTKVTDVKGTKAKLHGNLTLNGVTKPAILDLEVMGTGKDPWGNTKAGFTATTKINRKDFGIIWNKGLDQGGVLLGDDVEISLEIEAQAKATEAKKS